MAYWLAENGDVLTYARGSAFPPILANTGFPIGGGTKTFPNTALSLDFSGRYLFACSSDGTFYSVDTTDWSSNAVAMGGAQAAVGFTPAPFVDNSASNAAYTTVYAVNNVGVLYRITIDLANDLIANSQPYTLPRTNTASIQEYFRTSPIVFKGQLLIATWRDSVNGPSFDRGSSLSYYTNVTAPLTGPGPALTTRYNTSLNFPAYATPSIEIDASDNTVLGFVPAGNALTMIKLFGGGDKIESLPLVVNDKSAGATGHPSAYSGALDDFTGIRNQCIIGPNGEVVVMNNNAMFKLSHASATDDPTWSYTDDGWFERQISWQEFDTTWYALSAAGTAFNTTSAGTYIHNTCQLAFDWGSYGNADGGWFYAMDSDGTEATSTAVFLNRFGVGANSATAPNLSTSFDLRLPGLDANATQLGGLAIASDTLASPIKFIFNTRANTNNPTQESGLWVYP